MYCKYREMGEHDLKRLKASTFEEENYDQVENFVDYQVYLRDAFFSHLIKHSNIMYELMKTGASNIDFVKETLLGVFNADGAEDNMSVVNPTQDIKVVQPKYFAP